MTAQQKDYEYGVSHDITAQIEPFLGFDFNSLRVSDDVTENCFVGSRAPLAAWLSDPTPHLQKFAEVLNKHNADLPITHRLSNIFCQRLNEDAVVLVAYVGPKPLNEVFVAE